MELTEAIKLCSVFEEADGGCPTCVRNIIDAANAAGLGFTWLYDPPAGRDPRGKVVVDGEA